MEEIKVNEYVRTKNGKIRQIKQVEKIDLYKLGKLDGYETHIYFETDGFPMVLQQNEELELKHGSNIIDLIEEGDYVNGKLIHKVDIRENSAYIYYGNGKTFCDYQIKDIVTKEQFNQMKYIVGDE